MYPVIVIIASAVALRKTYSSLKDGNVSIWFFGGISIVWLGAIGVSLWPESSSFFAKFLGIKRGVDFLLFVGLLLFLNISASLYVRTRANQRDITKIVRQIALRDLEKEKGDSPGWTLPSRNESQSKVDFGDAVDPHEA